MLFLLAIMLSVRLRFTDSDCPFGILELFLLFKRDVYTLIHTTCAAAMATVGECSFESIHLQSIKKGDKMKVVCLQRESPIRRVWRYNKETVNRKTDNAMVKRKRTNNDLQNTTQKTKDRVIRIPLKTRGELMWSGRVGSSCYTCSIHRVTLLQARW